MLSLNLLQKVPNDWWTSDEGREFLRKDAVVNAWVSFLAQFAFDSFFTITYINPATSGDLAIDRTSRLLHQFFAKLNQTPKAFIVAEPHANGTYHTHGMLKLNALDRRQAHLVLSALWRVGFAKYGRCGFSLIESEDRVRLYVAKYIVKGGCDHRFVGVGNDKGLSPSAARRARRNRAKDRFDVRISPKPRIDPVAEKTRLDPAWLEQQREKRRLSVSPVRDARSSVTGPQ